MMEKRHIYSSRKEQMFKRSYIQYIKETGPDTGTRSITAGGMNRRKKKEEKEKRNTSNRKEGRKVHREQFLHLLR